MKIPGVVRSYSPLYRVSTLAKSIYGYKLGIFKTHAVDIQHPFHSNLFLTLLW
ncbi:MAG: hypothetical protein V7K50_26840 [Nostoc sp.]|uniref:hypothetical protein n=1 Tax=Nostoc sp. TaxID=1180 RepID=UPI002FF5753D